MVLRASYARSVPFNPEAFGRRLAAARAWRGLEPKQVARHLGISSEAVNRWERGGLQRAPAKGQVLLLAEVLEQPADWLIEGHTPPWMQGALARDEDVLAVFAALDLKLDVDVVPRLEAIEAELRRLAEAVTAARPA